MLDLVLKFHEYSILKVLRLQKCLSVDWAVEKSWEAQVPHEVFHILLGEEVLIEIVSKVVQGSLEFIHFLLFFLFFVEFSD